jgi:thiamine biosynthesis protein ThiS
MKLESGQSLLKFLEANQFDTAALAVARNGDIVPRATYDRVMLSDGDTLELVRFVGGG